MEGRELDVLVAKATGARIVDCWGGPPVFGMPVYYLLDEQVRPIPNYSTDIAAAWQVLEKLSDTWLPSVFHDGQLWVCELDDLKRKIVASAPQPELAICRCALKTTEVQ